ncbi:hypothetical protein EU245_04260 [Lentibacillus lipolyticus]|nr:hypothetical protein EU245_04260 [Lentibacillus lipolyticus]
MLIRWSIGAEGSRLLREQHVSEDPAAAVFREEAEAVPAESDCPERNSTPLCYIVVDQSSI